MLENAAKSFWKEELFSDFKTNCSEASFYWNNLPG